MKQPLLLAWRQLRKNRVRLLVAFLGVAFAAILMFLQLGFSDALYLSTVRLYTRFTGDLVMIHHKFEYLNEKPPFSRRSLQRALAYEQVAWVTPMWVDLAHWRDPVSKRPNPILVVGVDPARPGLALPALERAGQVLQRPEGLLFDELSLPMFGPIPELLARGERVETELNGQRVRVGGLFRLGTSLDSNGNVLVSDQGFQRLYEGQTQGVIHMGIIKLRAGADVRAVQRALNADATPDVRVLTNQELVALEQRFWAEDTPIGFVFGVGAAAGLIIGAIIVYQVLYADVTDHLPEYATLKAMGYSDGFLSAVVVWQGLLLAVLAFPPALAAAEGVFALTRHVTALSMHLTSQRVGQVLGATLAMCAVSGLLALRKVHTADPAEVF